MFVLDKNEQPVLDEEGNKLRAPCRLLIAGGKGNPCKRDSKLEPYRAKGMICPRPPLDPRDEHVVSVATALGDPVGQSGCSAANADLWEWETRFMSLRQRVHFRHLVAYYASEIQRLHLDKSKDADGDGDNEGAPTRR